MSVSKETKEQVMELRDEGLTYEQIAKKVKIRKSTVGQIVRSQGAADVKEGMISKVQITLCQNLKFLMLKF